MSYELISEEEYANLSDDDDRCFVEFEGICRRNMLRMIDENTSSDFDRAVRDQYMSAVAAVAAECHIPNVIFDSDYDENYYAVFSRFSLAVQGEVAKIRIRLRGERHPYSVLLTANTRTKIEHYVARIRDVVDNSDLNPDQRKRINEKLDDLVSELTTHRLSFAKTMAILTGVMAGLAGGVTIAAEGPNAVANIMRLIGKDKVSEDAAARRLAPPPKALPAPQARPTTARQPPTRRPTPTDVDDIPF